MPVFRGDGQNIFPCCLLYTSGPALLKPDADFPERKLLLPAAGQTHQQMPVVGDGKGMGRPRCV